MKRCKDCKWHLNNEFKDIGNFYMSCCAPDIKKGSACGRQSEPKFKHYVRKWWKFGRAK